MNGWEPTTLGDEFETVTGSTPSKKNTEYYGDFIPLVKPPELEDAPFNDASDGLSELGAEVARTVPPKSILVSCIGNLGKIGLNTVPVAFNQQINAIVPDENKAIPEFMFYQVLSNEFRFQLDCLASGTTVPIVNKSKFNSVQIVLPPLAEQKRIVAILDEAFAAIAQAKAAAEKNLANARELFESYLNRVFTQQGKEWEKLRFGDLVVLQRGHNPPKSKFIHKPRKGYVRFWQIRDGWSDGHEVYVPDSPKLHKVEEDDILMVAYRHIGRRFRGVSGAFNVALCKIKNADPTILNANYLYHLIPTEFVKGELLKRSERSLIPSMSVKHLAEISVPVPSLVEQEKLVQEIESALDNSQRLETIYTQKLANLDELKQSLLQKAFTGQLTAETVELAV